MWWGMLNKLLPSYPWSLTQPPDLIHTWLTLQRRRQLRRREDVTDMLSVLKAFESFIEITWHFPRKCRMLISHRIPRHIL